MIRINREITITRRVVLAAAAAGAGLAALPGGKSGELPSAMAAPTDDVFSGPDLIIATFFTASTEPASDTDPHRPIDRRIGLYATNSSDPTDFTYLGETGISGRDSSLAFHDGVFYLLTTADQREQFAVNVYKSTDLVTWTVDDSCRYEITTREPKRDGDVYNWGPKWIEDISSDCPRTYVIISLEGTESRITEGQLPFSPYPIMNTYIIPADGWDDPKACDLDTKTLHLGTPQRVNWGIGEGLSYKIVDGVKKPISRIGGFVDVDQHNKHTYGYRYIMFVKVDPWGDIEIWGADDILTDKPWARLSPWLPYADFDPDGPSNMVEKTDDGWKVRRVFEGNYPIHIGDQTYLYTDNYAYKATNLLTDGGMYYLSCTDYLKGFDNPHPITTSNTDARPEGIDDYVTRNGTIKYLPDRHGRDLIEQFAANEVFYSTSRPTKDPVTVTVRSNEFLKASTGWTLAANKMRLSKVFTQNAQERVEVITETGQVVSVVDVDVSNIST